METIELKREDGVAIITINRPDHGNRWTWEMFESFRKISLSLCDRPPMGVIILANGEDFSTGLQMRANTTLRDLFETIATRNDTYRAQEILTHLSRCLESITQVPAPVVCGVQGVCAGPGLALLLASDLRVISNNSTFSIPQANGLMDGIGATSRIFAEAGQGAASHLALVGGTWDAVEMELHGLVSQSCKAEVLKQTALQTLSSIINSKSPSTSRATLMALRQLRRTAHTPIAEQIIAAAARTVITGDWRQLA